MEKACLLSSLSLLAAVALTGCGGGGSGPAPGPAPPPGPATCPFAFKRGHCTHCEYSSDKGMHCTTCQAPYQLSKEAKPQPAVSCIVSTCTPGPKPAKPPNDPQGNNGATWPTMCMTDKDTSVFFGIGDWGGMCGYNGIPCSAGKKSADCAYKYGNDNVDENSPCPMPNHNGPYNKAVEGRVQRSISDRMAERYKIMKDQGNPHQFVVNVGDNFYPGGIDMHCGLGGGQVISQFETVWKGVYPGELTSELEWWSVLGNHDYGGVCYIKGWDQQIWYTYQQDKWVMPGQFWKRSVQYKNFKADFFFLDGNWFDTAIGGGGQDPAHDICNAKSNPGLYCEQKYYPGAGGDCPASGPHSPDNCGAWFSKVIDDQYNFLVKAMKESDADWQIIVTHYPASYNLGRGATGIDWAKWMDPMGVDLFISGHKHEQRIAYLGEHENIDTGKTAWVITGGGGGVTTDSLPVNSDGNDDAYGFMEFTMSATEINIKTYTHGGVDGKQILRNQTTVAPVDRKSDKELLELGLIPEELVKFGRMPAEAATVV